MGATGGASAEVLNDGAVDIHAHCVPAEFLALLSSLGDPRNVPSDDLVDLDRRLAAMDQEGIAVQVLSPFMDLAGYHLVGEQARDWAMAYNDALARETERQPDRLAALATVPLMDGSAAALELARAMDYLGMFGIEVGTHIGERQLDHPDLEVLWREASERRAIVLVHPFEPLPGTDLTDYGMVHLVGRPAESTIAAARLIFSGVLDRYRDIRFVIAHGGGFLPYQIGRLAKGYEARPENSPALHRSPALAFQSLFFDTVLSDRRSLKALVEIAGRDQVLLGSDYPFFIGDLEPARSLEAVEGLTDDDRRGIGGDNARRLMYDTIRRGRGTK